MEKSNVKSEQNRLKWRFKGKDLCTAIHVRQQAG